MFTDKKLQKILFGKCMKYNDVSGRTFTINFPKKEDEDVERNIIFAGDDGLILYLIKRIEKLEKSNKK